MNIYDYTSSFMWLHAKFCWTFVTFVICYLNTYVHTHTHINDYIRKPKAFHLNIRQLYYKMQFNRVYYNLKDSG